MFGQLAGRPSFSSDGVFVLGTVSPPGPIGNLEPAERPLVSVLRRLSRKQAGLAEALLRHADSLTVLWSDLETVLLEPSTEIEPSALSVLNAQNRLDREVIDALVLLRSQLQRACASYDRLADYLAPPSIEAFCAKYRGHLAQLPVAELELGVDEPAEGGVASIDANTASSLTCAVCYDLLLLPAAGADGDQQSPQTRDDPASQAPPQIMRIRRRCDQLVGSRGADSRRQHICGEHACQCRSVICEPCLLKHYWTQSNHENKSFAQCPFCRAQFCLLDLERVRYRPAATASPTPPGQQQQQLVGIKRRPQKRQSREKRAKLKE
jgi:hypothetical protein